MLPPELLCRQIEAGYGLYARRATASNSSSAPFSMIFPLQHCRQKVILPGNCIHKIIVCVERRVNRPAGTPFQLLQLRNQFHHADISSRALALDSSRWEYQSLPCAETGTETS